MMAQGAELPDCFENKALREGVCFYKALTAARSFLWLSWPGAAHTQDDARASAALNPVRSLLRVPFAEPSAAMLAATPEAAPVSYTHLDVYKRQALSAMSRSPSSPAACRCPSPPGPRMSSA